jgi:dihydrofolate reductase
LSASGAWGVDLSPVQIAFAQETRSACSRRVCLIESPMEVDSGIPPGARNHAGTTGRPDTRLQPTAAHTGHIRQGDERPGGILLCGETMAHADSRVTIHMAASLDGFIARKDGSVAWLETSDEFAGGETMAPEFVKAFLETIDCYVMGSRTYETALGFEAQGLGWSYGDKPTFVLTRRDLPRTRDTIEFHSGDLAQFVTGRLRPTFRTIWFVGGSAVSAECLRLGLADEVRYSILPILIGDGIPFFERLDKDVALHLAEVKAYRSGMVELRYEVRA